MSGGHRAARARHQPSGSVRGGFWSVPIAGRLLLLAVEGIAIGCLVWSIVAVGFGDLRDVGVFVLLVAVGLVCSQAARIIGPGNGVTQDFHSVWILPVALLLPAPYALLAAIADRAWTQWRIRPTLPHRQVFNAATIGLSHFCAGRVFHLMASDYLPGTIWLHHTTAFFGCTIAAAFCRRIINTTLIRLAAVLALPEMNWRAVRLDREALTVFMVEGAESICTTLLVALNPIFVVTIIPPVVLLHRGLIHNQLARAARLDAKTGLLNFVTWRSEAEQRIVDRSAGALLPAVLLLDIDHFKTVNDTYGHLVGDAVLVHVANLLVAELRAEDIVGRFGGEEFVAMIRVGSAGQAKSIAVRIGEQLVLQPAIVQDTAVPVTISTGVATYGVGGRQIDELLAAADAALYTAKGAGRNQVASHQG